MTVLLHADAVFQYCNPHCLEYKSWITVCWGIVQFGLESWQGCIEKIFSFTIVPIDGPLWFLRTLMFFAILSPLLWLFLRIELEDM